MCVVDFVKQLVTAKNLIKCLECAAMVVLEGGHRLMAQTDYVIKVILSITCFV